MISQFIFVFKKNKLLIFPIFLFFILAASCTKTKNFDNLDILVQKDWRLVSIEMNGDSIHKACDLDDVLFFEDSKNYTYNYGDNYCFDYEKGISATTWKLINDYTVLRMKEKIRNQESNGSLVKYWEIIELNDTVLILKDDTSEDNDQVPEIRKYQNN